MAGFLVAEEGLNSGLVIRFEEGKEWVIGRDPDVSYQVLEDPMVSRKHVICRATSEGYVLENLSAVNPATINGKQIEEPTLLQEGDAIQIGSDIFHFTLKDPEKHGDQPQPNDADADPPTIYEETEDLGALAFGKTENTRWMLKVISGPNSGAEFGVSEEKPLVIGKNTQTCDILFQDLSVSTEHAKLSIDKEGNVTIADLKSLNGVYINGKKITEPTKLNSEDLVALGTTSFLLVDQQQSRETIISPISGMEIMYGHKEEKEESTEEEKPPETEEITKKNWKKMVIPIRHLVMAGFFGIFMLVAIGGVVNLFKSDEVIISKTDEIDDISNTLKPFPEVEFSYNPSTGKIFILGHVMTEIDHQELLYFLNSLSFIKSIENNVIIDELVWENTNALLVKNSSWRAINLTSIIPGHFVLRGYVQTIDEATKLSEYININFPYLDKLDNQVVVENTLEAQIQNILIQANFDNVTFQFSNGELVLAGRIPSSQQASFNKIVENVKKVKGIRMLKNFVVFSQPSNDIIDISSKYKVTGSSKYGTSNQYVVINGKILSTGDNFEGMVITNLQENALFLEKDGIKYKINYNQP